MKLTVGIVTYERPAVLVEALDALLDQTRLPDEVIVVSDSASGRSADAVEPYEQAFASRGVAWRFVERREAASLPGARNVVVEAATGDVICFLDDDAVPVSGWLEAIEATYRERDAVAVGGPALATDEDLTLRLEPVTDRRDWNWINEYGEVSMEADRWKPPETVECDALMGANMTFRAGVFDRVGGFDPGYGSPAIFEDVDMLARLREEPVLYVPEAVVYHKRAESGGTRVDAADLRKRYYWFGRNAVRLRRRRFPGSFPASLLRLFLYNPGLSPTVFEQLRLGVALRTTAPLWWSLGYVGGLVRETLR